MTTHLSKQTSWNLFRGSPSHAKSSRFCGDHTLTVYDVVNPTLLSMTVNKTAVEGDIITLYFQASLKRNNNSAPPPALPTFRTESFRSDGETGTGGTPPPKPKRSVPLPKAVAARRSEKRKAPPPPNPFGEAPDDEEEEAANDETAELYEKVTKY